jgi:LEA14-like dessication related protein
MKSIFVLLLVLSTTFSAKSSFWYKDLEFLAMENFIVSKSEDKIIIKFDYVIKNDNWYAVTIKPSLLNLNVAETDCGDVYIPKKIKIKRKSKSSYPFVLVGDASKFSKSGFMSVWNMFTKGSVDLILKGKIKAGVFGLTKKWNLDYLYKMSWQEFMSFF